jgi:hypothetical protein
MSTYATATVEGVMDYATLVGTPLVKIKQDKPGKRIDCHFHPVTQVQLIRDTMSKRVVVTGTAEVGMRGEVVRIISIDSIDVVAEVTT